jgi:hypothetical protein
LVFKDTASGDRSEGRCINPRNSVGATEGAAPSPPRGVETVTLPRTDGLVIEVRTSIYDAADAYGSRPEDSKQLLACAAFLPTTPTPPFGLKNVW